MAHLIRHPFVSRVLEDTRPHMDAGLHRVTQVLRDTGDFPPPTGEADTDDYGWRVARRTIALLSRIERLHDARRYLLQLPAPALLRKLETTSDSWLEYHFAQYLSALASVSDICLLLCNAVFDLGMPARLCSVEAIKANSHVKRTPVPAALTSIEGIIRPHRELRNRDVHRGDAADIAGILGDRTVDMLRMVGIVARASRDVPTERMVVRGFRYYAKDLAERISSELEALDGALGPLLDGLTPVYDKKARLRVPTPAYRPSEPV